MVPATSYSLSAHQTFQESQWDRFKNLLLAALIQMQQASNVDVSSKIYFFK